MKKTILLVNILIAAVLVLSACSPAAQPETAEPPTAEVTELPVDDVPVEEPTPAPIVVTDDLGFEILLAEPAIFRLARAAELPIPTRCAIDIFPHRIDEPSEDGLDEQTLADSKQIGILW